MDRKKIHSVVDRIIKARKTGNEAELTAARDEQQKLLEEWKHNAAFR